MPSLLEVIVVAALSVDIEQGESYLYRCLCGVQTLLW